MFAFLTIVLFAVVLRSSEGGYCDFVKTQDCSTHASAPFCGSDGKTYNNDCYLYKRNCAQPQNQVTKHHDGACIPPTTTTTTTTTTIPTTTVNSEQVALDIFCLDIAYIQCGTGGQRVCSTNGHYYPNLCEFDKARCTHRHMHANGTNCQ